MEMKSIRQQQASIREQLLSKLLNDNLKVKQLADDMAESATNIHGQGYSLFVHSREQFFSELDRLRDEYSLMISPDLDLKKM
jgi:hypothetical protein